MPQTAAELAADAAAARRAGAFAVHVHPRDTTGAQTLGARECDAAVAAIRSAVPGLPVGLSTAAFLRAHGVACTLVERRPGTSPHPRARGINPRAVEDAPGLPLERLPFEQFKRSDEITCGEPVALLQRPERFKRLGKGGIEVSARCGDDDISGHGAEASQRPRACATAAPYHLEQRFGAVHALPRE